MAQCNLRVYYGPEDEAISTVDAPAVANDSVTVPLAEILPLLADAARHNRTWVRDFEDDAVTISNDLYEIILAYEQLTRPSA